MGFHASADLLGDGSLTLLSAPGHTRGNLAVAMKGAEGVYVHVGDAVFQRWEYAALGGGPCLWARVTAYDAKEMRRTYGSLRACEALPERPIIVPSHDIDVFDTLPHRPRSMAWNGASVAV
jgi:glyoxylase-like metal-dependent hydrolase (beta-lactamase superfamily II)